MSPSACIRFAPMIGARAGELSEEEAEALGEHLATCDACRARLADEEALSGMLSQALLAEANARDFSTFADGVLERIPERAWRPAGGAAGRGATARAGGLLGWLRRHRAAAVAGLLAPALAALAVVVYVQRDLGTGVPDDALVEVTAEAGGATVLETSDGPVVLLGEGEPEGT